MRFKLWLETQDLRSAWEETRDQQGICQFNPSMGCHDFAVELKDKLDGATTLTIMISHKGHESWAQHSLVVYQNQYADASGIYSSLDSLVQHFFAASRIPYNRDSWRVVNVDDI